MDIEQELQRLIDADIEDWQARKEHQVRFCADGGEGETMSGALWIDGKAFRPGLMVENHWASLAEAKQVAARLGVPLQMD